MTEKTGHGYLIVAALPDHRRGGRYILCDRAEDGSVHRFVTWWQSPAGDCYWGNYTNDYDEAYGDLLDRAGASS